MSIIKRFPIAVKIVLFLALFSSLAFYYFSNLERQWFHVDEYHFIRKSYYFDLFFTKRDFNDPRWYILGEPLQPKLGTYIYGLTLHLAGIGDIEKSLNEVDYNTLRYKGSYWWLKLWKGEFRYEKVPEELLDVMAFVWTGRKTSVVFALGSLLLVSVLGAKMKSIFFGLYSATLLGLNKLMFSYGRLAMTDSMQIFFYLANLILLLLLVEALQSGKSRKTAILSIFIGINAALGLGVKVTGILILIFVIILLLVFFALRPVPKKRPMAVTSFLIIISTFWAIFVFTHPYVQENGLRGFVDMFTTRLEGAKQDKLVFPASAVRSRWDAVKVIAEKTILPKGNYTNFRVRLMPIDLTLLLLGLATLFREARNKFQVHKEISSELVLLLWSFLVIGGLIFYLENNWPRYFLPAVSVIAIIESYGVCTIFEFLLVRTVRIRTKLGVQ